MLLKLIWIIVLAWIAVRVYRAGRDLVRVAAGREPGPIRPPGRSPEPAKRPAPREEKAPEWKQNVEDAKFEDIS